MHDDLSNHIYPTLAPPRFQRMEALSELIHSHNHISLGYPCLIHQHRQSSSGVGCTTRLQKLATWLHPARGSHKSFCGVKHILFKARDKINANQLYEAKLAEVQRQELQVAQASAGEG